MSTKMKKTTKQAPVKEQETTESVEASATEPEVVEGARKPEENQEPSTKDELVFVVREMMQVAFAFDKDPEDCTAEELEAMILKEGEEMAPTDFKQKGATTADVTKDEDWAAEQAAVVFSDKGCDILCRLGVKAAIEYREKNPAAPVKEKKAKVTRTKTSSSISVKSVLFELITEGKYTKKELIELLKKRVPGKSDSSYTTAVSDSKNSKYCGTPSPAVVGTDGVFHY